MSRRAACAWLAGAVALAGCAAQAPPVPPAAEGPAQPVEEGLWMISRRSEQAFATSGLRIEDADLAGYLQRVTCRVAGSYCPDIRTYGAAVPDFNASMAPNGFMQVWTGLLLRVENEAQLATVLAHEVTHYVERHSLEQFRTTRRTASVLLAAQFGAALGGVGGVTSGPVRIDTADIGRLIARGYLAAYSREQEAEADRGGFRRTVDAGYAPGEAAEVWANLMAEKNACDLPSPPALFASHPPSDERLAALRELARQTDEQGSTGRADFLEATLPHRADWLRAELAARHLCRVRVVIERLLDYDAGHGVLRYYQGEMYRLRSEDGDLERAIDAYRKALAHADAPRAAHRDLGLALWRAGRGDEARRAFRAYLDAGGEPDDAAMVRDYLAELKS